MFYDFYPKIDQLCVYLFRNAAMHFIIMNVKHFTLLELSLSFLSYIFRFWNCNSFHFISLYSFDMIEFELYRKKLALLDTNFNFSIKSFAMRNVLIFQFIVTKTERIWIYEISHWNHCSNEFRILFYKLFCHSEIIFWNSQQKINIIIGEEKRSKSFFIQSKENFQF